MSSSDRPTPTRVRQQPPPPPRHHPYFFIVLTNYPRLLSSTTHSQQQPANDYWQPYEPQRHRYSFAEGGVLSPGEHIQSGDIHSDVHEQWLYNGLRFELGRVIRNYLNETRRVDPIYFVFDWSTILMSF